MQRCLFFFFFKQKTAYEIGVRLVGSEMCIRDRCDCKTDSFAVPDLGKTRAVHLVTGTGNRTAEGRSHIIKVVGLIPFTDCLLYTSDAADEEDSVDLGGRRIIKKKKSKKEKKKYHKKKKSKNRRKRNDLTTHREKELRYTR